MAQQKPESFWACHDWIFAHQEEVNTSNVKEKVLGFGTDQKLDTAKLSSCIDSHVTAAAINETSEAGRRLQVQQTPTFFVNGRMITGAVPWTSLDAIIQLELNRPKDIPAPSTAKCCEVSVPTIIRK
jgi:protein-disulfide isomerase